MIIEGLLGFTLAAALFVFVVPDRLAGKLATALSLVPLAGSLWMFSTYSGEGNAFFAGGDIAFQTRVDWVEIGQYTLQWNVGVDGISLPLLVLTTILTTLALVSSWTPIDERQSQFYGLMLLLETALIGVFTGLDFFLWFIFWEAVLIPMYLLIGIWGGPRRKYAAIKFLLYTNIASLVLFAGFALLVFGLGDSIGTLSMPEITQALHAGELDSFAGLSAAMIQELAFLLLFVGFAVKVPVVPFHTWLPDAHVEAPTPVSVILAGVLLKMGTYALLRFNFTMLPEVAMTSPVPEIIAAVGVLSVIYGAMLALAQQDLKRIVAYSSISSMGYVLIGLVAFTPHGMGGATFQMVSHGLISGLMFMAVGVLYNATHTRMVGDMSGLADRMPWAVGIFVAGAFGYMGLPLMSGFAAEVLIFIGSFDGIVTASPLVTGVAMFGIVIVAGYLLWAMQRTLFGPFELETEYEVGRAPLHDVAPLAVLLGLVILLGVNPDLIYELIQDGVNPLVEYATTSVTGGELA
ncbi:complex I subunit 4 family protein [Halovenus marina]|uniref:complex I subunit 4 family protein n=1 Tax=Halovenus marina TaxID=3396621 RepID=UPI003F5523D1